MKDILLVLLILLLIWKSFTSYVSGKALIEFKKMALDHNWEISKEDVQKMSKSIFKRKL